MIAPKTEAVKDYQREALAWLQKHYKRSPSVAHIEQLVDRADRGEPYADKMLQELAAEEVADRCCMYFSGLWEQAGSLAPLDGAIMCYLLIRDKFCMECEREAILSALRGLETEVTS